jgi:hypothetical protein
MSLGGYVVLFAPVFLCTLSLVLGSLILLLAGQIPPEYLGLGHLGYLCLRLPWRVGRIPRSLLRHCVLLPTGGMWGRSVSSVRMCRKGCESLVGKEG